MKIRKISKAQRKRMVRNARKAAAKARATDIASLKKVRIQTVAPWKRWVLGGIGMAFLSLGIFLRNQFPGAFIIFGLLAMITILFAILGKKKSIDAALNGVDSSITDQIFTRILDQLF